VKTIQQKPPDTAIEMTAAMAGITGSSLRQGWNPRVKISGTNGSSIMSTTIAAA
jgi:hypothetical protein